jgi:penicillin V acylase-like amidase (Ntn superfamily)
MLPQWKCRIWVAVFTLAVAIGPVGASWTEQDAHACSGFGTGMPGGYVLGKSYDWNLSFGLVVFNPRGLKKSALHLDLQETPAVWTSNYASLTFDQYACEMPNGGINEAGLAIELMVLGGTQYPFPDERPAVNELQYIQYALDSFASVEEMIEGTDLIRIRQAYAGVHYLACDASGNCASFEWLNGELALATAKEMPAPTLTNSSYEESAKYLANFEGFGGFDEIPGSSSSLDRFVRASSLAAKQADGEVPGAAFSILESVAQGDFSKWNIVYDLEKRVVHFRTLSSPEIKRVALSDFDPDCAAGHYILDIDHPVAGDVSAAFEPYTMEANKALIEKSLSSLPGVPEIAITILAVYPDSLECIPATDPEVVEEVEVELTVEAVEMPDVLETIPEVQSPPEELIAAIDLPAGGAPEGAVEREVATRGGCSAVFDAGSGTSEGTANAGAALLFTLLLVAIRRRKVVPSFPFDH